MRRLLFTTALKSSAIRSANYTQKMYSAATPAHFDLSAAMSLLGLSQKLVHGDFINQFKRNENIVGNNTTLYPRQFNMRALFPIDELDAQLNQEWGQYFSIFNLEDLILMLTDNTSSYYSAYDFSSYTQNVKNQNSALFDITYTKRANLSHVLISAEDLDLYMNYAPHEILAKDIEMFLHEF